MATTPMAVGKVEAAAFRFVLLAWIVGAGFVTYTEYAHIEANREQETVENLQVPLRDCIDKVLSVPICGKNTEPISPCDRELKRCNSSPDALRFQAAIDRMNQWTEQIYSIEWIGPSLLLGAFLLFYVVRWGLTGRVRPLWPLRSPQEPL